MTETSQADLVPLPDSVGSLLHAFASATGLRVRLFAHTNNGRVCLYGDGQASGQASVTVPVPGPARIEIETSPEGGDPAKFLARAIGQAFQHEREARSAARELTERYEEINLLYSISEILASVMSVTDATERILAEVADVLGASDAALWVFTRTDGKLHLAASVGDDAGHGPISIDAADAAAAWVFRTQQTLNIERGGDLTDVEGLVVRPHGDDAVLSVPINYTPPGGRARAIGVVTLVGRRTSAGFSAGDARLLSAVASQIGAALETHRLFEESLRQERTLRELELAHDLQLKLLPDTSTFEGPPEVAARCVPAESVGGDFYQLFRLSSGRLGVVIGDVSTHGFGAALIMALTLSAVAIYAPESGSPGEVIRQLDRALADELESTEMFLSIFYGVLDFKKGKLSYAGAGHPHAFRVGSDGDALRLEATCPPMGLAPLADSLETTVPWRRGHDLLLLFTDGLSDAFSETTTGGEALLLDQVTAHRDEPLADIVDHLFRHARHTQTGKPSDDRTALLVRG